MTTAYTIIRASDEDDQSNSLRNAYYELRQRAFAAYWGENLYPNGPDILDVKPSTTLVLAVEDGKVIAGTRLIFHTPGSNEKVRMEESHRAMALSNLLPDIDASACSYCEIGGLVSDPDIAYRSRRLGTGLLKHTLQSIVTHDINNAGAPIDLALYSASKPGLPPIIEATAHCGIPSVVRDDLIQREEDPRFDTQLWPIILGFNPEIPLNAPHTKPLSSYKRGSGNQQGQ